MTRKNAEWRITMPLLLGLHGTYMQTACMLRSSLLKLKLGHKRLDPLVEPCIPSLERAEKGTAKEAKSC